MKWSNTAGVTPKCVLNARTVTAPRGERRSVNFPAIPTQEKITRMGRYEVRSTWRGNGLDYDIFRNGLLYTCGFDRLSPDENTALEGIADRLYGMPTNWMDV